MNHAYRLVWNEAAQREVPAAEASRSRGKTGCCKALRSVILAAGLGAACIGTAEANPTGGTVVAGQGTLSQSGNTTTINQQSQSLSLNWVGFSIAPGQTVQFLQPSSSAVALNRVTGSEASQIYGNLQANGQVFLVNPNGVLFGRGAQVNVGGLVASTLNITDADFLAGNYRFQANSSATSGTAAPAGVVNQGAITAAAGGSVALLGGQVSNQGTIRAQLGSVALAAGGAMTLDFRGNKLLNVKVDQSAVGALAENQQLIQADGGTVIMTAAARDALLNTVVNNTGVIEARTLQDQGGEIKLLGSSEGGTVNVGGTLDASAANGGNGGTIETSGEHVKVADNAAITTKAPYGQSGTWVIDPPDFTIAASGGDISGATLGANLDNGNVTILSSQGSVNTSGSGDINVNDDVSWTSGTKLTLSAVGNVNVNAVIANRGSQGNGSAVTLRADSAGACVAGTAVCGTVNFSDYFQVQADTVNIYYNPSGSNAAAGANGSGPSYATPTDFSSDVTGTVSGGVNAFMLVNDVNQLQAISESSSTLAGSYALGRDIDASATSGWNGGAGFVPVGYVALPFSGSLDGLGHTISGLTINLPSTNQVGLFTQTGVNSVVSNVGLIGGSVTGLSNVGELVGVNRGVIDNAFTTGSVAGNGAGGLGGSNQGSGIVKNSHATGNVSGTSGTLGAGGLVGQSFGIITNSYATGNVSSANARSGGLVGYMGQNASITGSYASGNVFSTNSYGGGLVGYFDTGGVTTANITDSYASGSVRAATSVGGLVGAKLGAGGSVTRSYSIGAVTGTGNLGGLVGSWTGGGTITGSFWDTQASGQSASAGGGVGMTTAQMKTQANFKSATAANGNVNPGWDLAGVWRMYDGHTAPLLKALLTPLTVTADNISSTYNGTASTAGLTNAGYSIAGADTSGHLYGVTTAYAGDRNAGTYAAGIWSDQQGYDITLVGGNLTIDKAPLALTTSNVTKTYDGTTSAGGALVITGGTTLYGTDSLNGGAFAYTDKNAGVGNKTVATSGVTVSDGNGGNNYNVTYIDNTTSTINRAALTISAASNTKTYDGTTAAAAAPIVSGLQGDDSVTGLQEVYTTQNAGTGKTLYVNSYTINDSNGGANYALTLIPNSNGVIDKANITVSASNVTKTYDGTISAAGNAVVTGGTRLFGTDGISGGTFTYTDKNAGVGNKIVTTAGVTISDGNGGDNYNVTYVDNTNSTINPALLTIAAVSNTKTYDGTIAAAAVPTLSGLATGDTVTGLSESYADKNFGSGKALSVTGYVINDSNGGKNYTVNTVDNTSGVINKAALVIATSDVTKTYDGTTSAIGAPVATDGTTLYGSDTLSGGIFAYTDKNAGIGNKAVTTTGVSVNDGNGGNNYDVSYKINVTSSITPAALTITAASNRKTYDGTTAAAAIPTVSGLVAGDTVTDISEVYNTKDAQVGKTLSVAGYTVNDANAGKNYTVSTVDNTAGIIDKASLKITTGDVAKTYDGTTAASGVASITGGTTLYGTDSFSGGIFAYTDKNAGIGNKTVTVAGVTVADGNGGNNYDVMYVNNTTSTITPAALTIAAAANTKAYDGTTIALALPTLSGLQAGDVVTGLSESYSDKNAGTGKTLLVTGYVINDGNAGGNYVVNRVNNDSGAISKANLIVSTTDVAKTYDGTTSATGIAVAVGGTALYGADSLSGGTFAYTDRNAGSGDKAVTVGGVTVSDGNGGGNYAVTYENNNTSTITPAALTITAVPNTKTYDGTTTAVAAPTLSGLVAGDTVTALTESYADRNSGTGKTLSVTGYVINDSNGGKNYSVNTVADHSGVIDKANLVVGTSNVSKTYDGTTSAFGTATAEGGTMLYGTDSLSGGMFAYTDKNAGLGTKTVTTAGVTVNDGNGGHNYSVTYVDNTTSTITPAALIITAASNTKTYDGTTVAVAVPTFSGLVAGDTITGLSEAYDTKNAGIGKTLAVTNYVINDSNGGGNYTVSTVANSGGVINKANLVLAASTFSKTYDGTNAAGGSVTASGNVAGDTVSATEAYASKNVLGAGGSTLRVAGYSVADSGGVDMSGNYNVVMTTAAGTISPAMLAISGATAANKTYDGNVNATVRGGVLSGVLAGDSVSLLQSGVFGDRNAGTDKVVSEIFSLSGADASNYALISNTAQTAASIVPATITISGITANDKSYDATAAATLNTTSATLGGKIAGDNLGILATGSFSDANAGSSKTVTLSGLTLTGGSKGNYVLAASGNESVTTASITPVNVQVTANNQSKVAGAPNPEFTLTYSGFVAGQDRSSLTTQPTVATAATTNSPAGQYAITVSGAADSNYTFSYVPGVLTITGNAFTVPSYAAPAYFGALASTSHSAGGNGNASDGKATDPSFSSEGSADSSGSGPFSEERALEARTHATDYLPILSLEILNGGLKMPGGVP